MRDKNAPEYFILLFGAAMTNVVTLAVNWRLAPPEMEYIINHAQAGAAGGRGVSQPPGQDEARERAPRGGGRGERRRVRAL